MTRVPGTDIERSKLYPSGKVAATAFTAVALSIAVPFTSPPIAVAKPIQLMHSVKFRVPKVDGYGVSGFGFSTARGKGVVALDVSRSVGAKRQFGSASATYSAKGVVTGGSIRASFGRLGRIALQFHPRGPVERHRNPDCKNLTYSNQRGAFVGHIVFRGESRYVQVDRRMVPGSVTEQPDIDCVGSEGVKPPKASKKVEVVSLESGARDRSVAFSAAVRTGDLRMALSPDGPLVTYMATTSDACQRVSVPRSILIWGSASTFVFDRPLASATVTPPPPFSGSATFTRDPATGQASWTGSLAAPFLGATLPLTGSGFHVDLKRERVDPSAASFNEINCPSDQPEIKVRKRR